MMDESDRLKPVYNETTEEVSSPIHKGFDSEKTEEDSHEDDGALKPQLGLFSGVMIIVGCIIGSGIFISPKGVHEDAGSVGFALVLWILCGFFSTIGAYCYAELGTLITKSGGDYAYVFEAFGPFLAFLRMWIECIIVRPCTVTAVAVTFATYVLRPFYPHCNPPEHSPQLLAAGAIILLTMINFLSVRLVTMVQNVFTVAKLFALVLIIITGLVLLCMGGQYHWSFEDAFAGSKFEPGSIALAFYSGLWAYNGWNFLNFITEELENPKRNLPLAIAISMSLVMVIYILVNIAFYAGVTVDEMLDSPAVAVTFADRFYGKMSWVMPIFVAMSCFGTVNGVLLTSSRIFYVAGREQHMPMLLSFSNPKLNTPVPAVVFTGILSLLYLLLSKNIYDLIAYVQIVNWIAIGVATAGLLWLRRKMPVEEYPRPIKVNLIFPVVFLIGCVFLVLFPLIKEPAQTGIGIAIMLTGIPVYFVFVYWQNKPVWFTNAIDRFTMSMQKLMYVLPEEEMKKAS